MIQRILINDDPNEDISVFFNIILSINMTNKNIIVHCSNSVSCSVTIGLTYLIFIGMSLKESIIFLKSKRKFQYTKPNKGFFRQLLLYEQKVIGNNSLKEYSKYKIVV